MKKCHGVLAASLFLLLPALGYAEIPHQIAGFKLGASLAEFEDRIKADTTLPLRYTPYIEEVEINDVAGFKNGLIWIGKCTSPGRIVRIRLKYADSSKKFYNELLGRYRERFGKPAEWRGDPFHIVISWKWSFVDAQNNRISMILEHNTRDEEESYGNTVKLTMWNLIDEERDCAEGNKAALPAQRRKGADKKADWDSLLPR